jgi:hypothetical protein
MEKDSRSRVPVKLEELGFALVVLRMILKMVEFQARIRNGLITANGKSYRTKN